MQISGASASSAMRNAFAAMPGIMPNPTSQAIADQYNPAKQAAAKSGTEKVQPWKVVTASDHARVAARAEKAVEALKPKVAEGEAAGPAQEQFAIHNADDMIRVVLEGRAQDRRDDDVYLRLRDEGKQEAESPSSMEAARLAYEQVANISERGFNGGAESSVNLSV